MTYTVSHRQAGVTRADVAGLIRHEYRDVDKHNGVETQHSNERIVPSRTAQNQSYMWRDGQPVELTDSRQILEELDRRLAGAGGTRTNKKTGEVSRIAVRKDAKVVRNLVLQLDPEFTRSSEYLLSRECPAAHRDAVLSHMSEMIEHYADVYGRKNLLAASVHVDETSPHVHLMVTPIDDEGRVRQESFIKGPKGMSSNDRAMRARLKAHGYDVDPEPRGMNRSHMTIDEYAQHQAHEQQIREREIEVEDREVRLGRRESAVDARESDLATREHEAAERASEAVQRLAEATSERERARQLGQRAQKAMEAARAAEAEYLEAAESYVAADHALHRAIKVIQGARIPVAQQEQIRQSVEQAKTKKSQVRSPKLHPEVAGPAADGPDLER